MEIWKEGSAKLGKVSNWGVTTDLGTKKVSDNMGRKEREKSEGQRIVEFARKEVRKVKNGKEDEKNRVGQDQFMKKGKLFSGRRRKQKKKNVRKEPLVRKKKNTTKPDLQDGDGVQNGTTTLKTGENTGRSSACTKPARKSQKEPLGVKKKEKKKD